MQRRVVLIVCTVILRQQFIQRKLHRKETKITPLIEMKLNAIKTRSSARYRVRNERFSYATTTSSPGPTPTEQATTAPTTTPTTAPMSNTSTTTTSSTTKATNTTTAVPLCTETGPKSIWHGEPDVATASSNADTWPNETTDDSFYYYDHYSVQHMFDENITSHWHSHYSFEDQVKAVSVEFHVSTSILVDDSIRDPRTRADPHQKKF